MKRIIKLNVFSVALLIAFCLLTDTMNAQTIQQKTIWDYPIKPGTEEWKTLKNYEEKVKVCQIPEGILSSLSTEELTDLCLRYPPLYNIFAFNHLGQGLDKLFSDFNGIRELYKRKDMANSLTKSYLQKIQALSFLDEENSDSERGFFIAPISALEALISRIETEEKEKYKEILQSLVTGYETKLKYADYFKGSGFRTNYYSRGHIIAKMDNPFFEKLSQKEKNAILLSEINEHSFSLINELSYQLIK